MACRARRAACARDRHLLSAPRCRTTAPAGGRFGDRHGAGGSRDPALATSARLLDPHVGAQLDSRRRRDRSDRHAFGRASAVCRRTVAAHRRGHAARSARSRGLAANRPRDADHAGVLSHGKRAGTPHLVRSLRLVVPVRPRGSRASVPAPRRGGVSRRLDAVVCDRRRAAH